MYACFAAAITFISAIAIWYRQKWSIATVFLFILANTSVQLYLNHTSYFIIIVFTFIIWAQIEVLILGGSKENLK